MIRCDCCFPPTPLPRRFSKQRHMTPVTQRAPLLRRLDYLCVCLTFRRTWNKHTEEHEKCKGMMGGGGNRWPDSVTVRLPGNRSLLRGNVWKCKTGFLGRTCAVTTHDQNEEFLAPPTCRPVAGLGGEKKQKEKTPPQTPEFGGESHKTFLQPDTKLSLMLFSHFRVQPGLTFNYSQLVSFLSDVKVMWQSSGCLSKPIKNAFDMLK